MQKDPGLYDLKILNAKQDKIINLLEELNGSMEDLTNTLDQTSGGNSEFLTVQETADFLKVSVRLIYGLTANRTLPCIKVGRQIRLNKADVIKYFSEQNI